VNGASLGAAIAAAAALIAAYLSYRASTKANQVSDRKVDLEEHRDAIERLKKIIDEQDRYSERQRMQVDRLSTSMESVQTQLTRETQISSVLRDEIRALQGQVALLQRMADRPTI
jgi:gas vesicle protein